ARSRKPLRDRADEKRWIVGPRRRVETFDRLPGVAVRREERIEREAERRVDPAELLAPRAAGDRLGDARRSARRVGETGEVALEALERVRETLGQRVRIGWRTAEEVLVRLTELVHHRVR